MNRSFFFNVEPSLMHQGSINEPNATWEVLDPPQQDNPLFNSRP
jgi:hypothetical protein